jgi:glycosyltransferase involved in cell wall biosynthesis
MSRDSRIRLAAVSAAPVFYQAPLYKLLGEDDRLDFTVYFAASSGVRPYDAGFGGRKVVWDEDLLAGYQSVFLAKADRNNVLDGFFALRDLDITRKLSAGRYDVVWVHGYSYLTIWLAMATTFGKGMPLLIREEQTLLHQRSPAKEAIRGPILRALFQRSYGLYIGTNNREFFSHYGIPDSRLFPAPYCVDNHELQSSADRLAGSRQELRAQLGVTDPNLPLILFVGRLGTKKQPLLLLEAFERVRTLTPCALLVVGEGELEADMRNRIAEKRIPDVHMAGFLNRTEIVRAYAAADLFVLPSALHETWGLVVNEAMNFSLPIVVSDKVGSGRDLVSDGVNGYVCGHDDPEGFTTALHRLVVDPPLRTKMGRESRRIISGWNYGVAAEGIVQACEAATGRSPRRHVEETAQVGGE